MDATTIWSLRKPLQWVWRKLVVLAGAWTVEPIFRQAHDYHLSLRRWQQRWVELADGVEYRLQTRSSFDEDGKAEQSVWIRNSGTVFIDEVRPSPFIVLASRLFRDGCCRVTCTDDTHKALSTVARRVDVRLGILRSGSQRYCLDPTLISHRTNCLRVRFGHDRGD